MRHPRSATNRSREGRIWLLISAACLVPAVLGVLQTYLQAMLEGQAARWQDLVFEGGEWLFLGALLPITYHLGKRFPIRRTRWARTRLERSVSASDGPRSACSWVTSGEIPGGSLSQLDPHHHPLVGVHVLHRPWLRARVFVLHRSAGARSVRVPPGRTARRGEAGRATDAAPPTARWTAVRHGRRTTSDSRRAASGRRARWVPSHQRRNRRARSSVVRLGSSKCLAQPSRRRPSSRLQPGRALWTARRRSWRRTRRSPVAIVV
jgi:hypothetical protein